MIADFTISEATTIVSVVIAGIVSVIGAVVKGVILIRDNQKTADKKLDQIHELTNSNLTKVKQELEASKQELADLRKLVEGIATKGPVTASDAAKAESLTSPRP